MTWYSFWPCCPPFKRIAESFPWFLLSFALVDFCLLRGWVNYYSVNEIAIFCCHQTYKTIPKGKLLTQISISLCIDRPQSDEGNCSTSLFTESTAYAVLFWNTKEPNHAQSHTLQSWEREMEERRLCFITYKSVITESIHLPNILVFSIPQNKKCAMH